MSRSDSTTELKAISTRNATLERRLANAQNQLAAYDEKMESARVKMSTAETRWDARVKEYERIIKAGEEKVKSEKQGGKERAAQLEGQLRCVFISLLRSLKSAERADLPVCGRSGTWRSRSRVRSAETTACAPSSLRKPKRQPRTFSIHRHFLLFCGLPRPDCSPSRFLLAPPSLAA